MNTRKLFAIMGALLTGGMFISFESLVGHAEAAFTFN
jgi:hypothetical protein